MIHESRDRVNGIVGMQSYRQAGYSRKTAAPLAGGLQLTIHALNRVSVILVVGVLCVLVAACASRDGDPGEGTPSTTSAEVEAAWGLRVDRVSVTAGGGLIEVRYRVTDAEKAGRALSGSLWLNHGVVQPQHVQHAPLLIDEDSGYGVLEPSIHFTGRLAQQREDPQPGHSYFILFSNSTGVISRGDMVALSLAGTRLEHLKVE